MPEYTVEMNQENRPAGDPIELPPLGVIENGKSITVDLTREQAEYFAGAAGVKVSTEGGKGLKGRDYETVPSDLIANVARPITEQPPVEAVVPSDATIPDEGVTTT